MGLDPQRNFTVDLILGASVRVSVYVPLSPDQSTRSSPLEVWGSRCLQGKKHDSQWLSNCWRGRSTREVLVWSGTELLHLFCENRLIWIPRCSGAWAAPLLLQVRCLCLERDKSYRHPHGHFPWTSWNDCQLRVLTSHCHKPVLTVQSKESPRYFSRGCVFSRKVRAKSYIKEYRRLYVPCQV